MDMENGKPALYTERNDVIALESSPKSLVLPPKALIMNPGKSNYIDPAMVSFQYYNSFNYSLLQKDDEDVRLVIGVTSANPREGKSLVASNLAVSLTLGYKKRTILVDLNFRHPVLHQIFGTPLGPGLIDSLSDGADVRIWQTSIDQLHLLSCGGKHRNGGGGARNAHGTNGKRNPYLGLEQMTAFSDVITSLQQEYEFVVVDMPAMSAEDFPILFANRLGGILAVIDSTSTTRDDVEKIFQRLNERQVLGFILNRVKNRQR